MSERIYKKSEIIGTSTTGIDDAIKNAVERASKTIRNIRWFEVTDTTGRIQDGTVDQWQVTLKIGFALEN